MTPSPKVQAALDYLAKGFCPMPVHGINDGKYAKRPALHQWKEFSERLPTEAEIHAWWGNNPDWDMALVCGHGGLAVVDTDTQELFGALLQETGLEYTKIVKTKRGAHFWFIEEHPSRSGPLMDGVDIKSRDAQGKAGYVLVPPSTGYTFFNPDVPIQHIKNAREWGALRFGVSSHVNEEKLYQQVLREGEIPTGQRNATLASVGGKLLAAGMDTKFVPDVLAAINKTMAGEPLSDEEVRHTALSISRYEKEDKKKEPVWNTAWNNELESKEPEPAKWLVDGIVPMSGTTVIGGQEGVYKTYLALEMAYSLGEGKPWLSKFNTIASRSLFVDGENGLEVIHERVHQLRSSTKQKLWQALFLTDTRLDSALADKVIEHCQKESMRVVFFDPYRLFMGGDEDSSGEVAMFLGLMTKFHEKGIATIIQHHHRKVAEGFAQQDPTTMMLRGSNALAAHASSIIQLAPTKDGVKILHTKNRRGSKVASFKVVVGDGPTFTYEADDGASVFTEQEVAATAIRELLEANGGGMYRGHILSSLKKQYSERNIERAMKVMSEEGLLQKTRQGSALYYHFPRADEKQVELSQEEVAEIFEATPV